MATSAPAISPVLKGNQGADGDTGRGRWAFWRPPVGDPGYARPGLLAIAALAGTLYGWGIGRSRYHVFYADAVRSMSESWKAFLYGSYDPASTITLDKLPGFLWPQALSARVFGFHPWALTLPQAVEGVLAVLVLYRVVRRWAGVEAALLAAAAFTLTPVVAGLFRTSVEDPLFTLLLLLAADAAQRATHLARLRTLLLAGVWVGLAFQAKMLEAWALLPVLAVVYLVAAPTRLRRRLWHLALAGLVTVAVSGAWMLAATVTPARDRPYIDGTTDDSAYSMVVGYNFLSRFSAVGLSAEQTGSVTTGGPGGMGGLGGPASAKTPTVGVTGTTGAGAAGGAAWGGGHGGAEDGWGKLLGRQFAPQTGWLYPLAAFSALYGLARRRRTPRTDRLRAGYLLWGGWLAVFFLALSAGSIGPHTYYLGVIATPLAALSGAGTVLLWRDLRAGGRRALALPVAVAATAAWSAYLARSASGFLPWLAPTTLALGAAATGLLLWAARTASPAEAAGATGPGRPIGGAARAALPAALLAVLVAPGAWALSVLSPAYGASPMGTVGPAARPSPAGPAWAAEISRGEGPLTRPQQALLDYVRAHDGGARYLFATTDWQASSPYILATGEEVLPMGGFTGRAPAPSLDRVRELVAAGQLRYILLADRAQQAPPAGPQAPPPPQRAGTAAAAVIGWTRANCTPVAPAAYGAPAAATDAQPLYHCGPDRAEGSA